MKEKLTKKKALRHCVAMWEWLTENPLKEKEDWPEWEENGGKFQALSHCFACEYNLQQDYNYCNRNCIIPCFASIGHCTRRGSPYIYWSRNDSIESSIRNAEIIRNSAKTALMKLQKGKDDRNA